jgi:RHS repeat-associated protein
MAGYDKFGSNNTSDNSGVFGNSLIDDATLVAPLTESPSPLGIEKPQNNNSGNYDPFAPLNDPVVSKNNTTSPIKPVVNLLEQPSLFKQSLFTFPVSYQKPLISNKSNQDILTGINPNAPLVSSPEDSLTNRNAVLSQATTDLKFVTDQLQLKFFENNALVQQVAASQNQPVPTTERIEITALNSQDLSNILEDTVRIDRGEGISITDGDDGNSGFNKRIDGDEILQIKIRPTATYNSAKSVTVGVDRVQSITNKTNGGKVKILALRGTNVVGEQTYTLTNIQGQLTFTSNTPFDRLHLMAGDSNTAFTLRSTGFTAINNPSPVPTYLKLSSHQSQLQITENGIVVEQLYPEQNQPIPNTSPRLEVVTIDSFDGSNSSLNRTNYNSDVGIGIAPVLNGSSGLPEKIDDNEILQFNIKQTANYNSALSAKIDINQIYSNNTNNGGGSVKVVALRNGVLVGKKTYTIASTTSQLHFQSDQPFDKLQVMVANGNTVFNLGDVEFEAVTTIAPKKNSLRLVQDKNNEYKVFENGIEAEQFKVSPNQALPENAFERILVTAVESKDNREIADRTVVDFGEGLGITDGDDGSGPRRKRIDGDETLLFHINPTTGYNSASTAIIGVDRVSSISSNGAAGGVIKVVAIRGQKMVAEQIYTLNSRSGELNFSNSEPFDTLLLTSGNEDTEFTWRSIDFSVLNSNFNNPSTVIDLRDAITKESVTPVRTKDSFSSISAFSSASAPIPTISSYLVNDTGVFGTTNSRDYVTSDPTYLAVGSNLDTLFRFEASFQPINSNGTGYNLLQDFKQDGIVNFDRALLETIKGGPLLDGTHIVYVEGNAIDPAGQWFWFYDGPLIIYLDTAPPAQPTFNLEPGSDTGVIGDWETASATVNLVGQTEANAFLLLESTGERARADSTGRFTFANVPLGIGDNILKVRASDNAGNESAFSATIRRPLTIALTGSTITENSPIGTVIGRLGINDLNSPLLYTYTLVDNAGGRFQIVGNELQVADGTLLNFENNSQHSVTIRSTNGQGIMATQTFNIGVTNVNEAPVFTSTPTYTATAGNLYTYNITTTDQDAGDTRTITAGNLPSGFTLVDNRNGTATLRGTPTNGVFNFNLTATDAGGLKTVQPFTLSTVQNFSLVENTNFTATRPIPFAIPPSPSILSFKIDPRFDALDPDSIKDAFEVALVDAQGNPLVHTISRDKDAFFNWTEGEPVALGAGTTYNPATRTVSLNLTGTKANTNATLIFRLVNNDSDTTTQVTISDFVITPAPAGTQPPVRQAFSERHIPGAAPNFNLLTDVSQTITASYRSTTFNADSKLLYADISLRNTGNYSVDGPFIVGVKNISDPTVSLREPDGFTPDGIPYYDFSKQVADGKLDPNNPSDISQTRSLVFHNPNGRQFTYDLVVLAQLNKAPVIESKAITEVIAGRQYRYEVKATDPNNDTLSYRLLTNPDGMAINATSGVITWNTTASNRGNQAVVVEVSDGRGGVTTQRYTLSAIDAPPNRPPVFTSIPVVDATINTEYKYDADATDRDGDNLTYSLALGPDGMTVNPTTGEVIWTPKSTKVFGDTVIERIGKLGEKDTFTFGGVRGERIYIDSLIGNSSQTLQLFNPNGSRLIDGNTNYQGIINLPETGNYIGYISGAVGDYGFSFIDLNTAPIAAFDQDITGALTPGSEDDVYRFNGNAGTRLYFDTLSANNNLDWVIYGTDNQIIAESSWNDILVELPADGQYILALRGKGNYNDNIPYSFRIVTPDTTSTPLTLGTNSAPGTVSGSILEKGEQDVYTFAGTRGQRLYLDAISASSGISATLITPSSDKQKSLTNYRLDSNDSGIFTLEEDGNYRLVINGDGATTGAYSFNLLNASNATTINLDTDVNNQLDPGKETHLYRFSTTTANQRLYLDSLLGSTNASWTLYGPSNQVIRTANLNTDLDITLAARDTYTLAIQSNSDTPINYQFRVVNSEVISQSLTLGNIVSNSIIKKREQDIYTFSASDGARILLDAVQESPNINARLVSPSGVEVFSSIIANDATRNPAILPEAGNYQLIIEGVGEATGNYSFRLHNLNNATTLSRNTSTSGTLNPGSSTNLLQFAASAGERLYLDSQLAAPNATWLLYGPGNQLIDSKPLSDDFELVLPGSGNYYLVLRGDGSTTAINYRIQSTFSSATPTALTLGSFNNFSISVPGEQDVYTFNINIPGERLYFDPTVGNSNITARIVSPSGVNVWSGNTSADGVPIVLVETGSYRLILDGNNDTTGSYNFRLASLGNITNQSSLGNTTSLTLGTAVSGSLAVNETRLYSFNGTNGQRLQFDSRMTALNADWVLYAPGALIDGTSVVGSAPLSNDFEVTLPTNGTYILALRGVNNSTTTSFNFQVNNISGATVTNSGLGTPRSGTVTTSQPFIDTFTARAGSLVYFDSQISNELGGGVTARLLNPASSQVSSNIAAVDSNLIQIQQSGTHTLRLEGNGSYRYQMIDLSAATDLSLNANTNVTLTERAARAYKFNGAVGQQLFYDALNSNNPNATVRLFTPGGSQILNTPAQLDGGLITLAEGGTYYLIVSSNSASSTSVNFRLLDNSANGAASLTLDTSIANTFAEGGFETDLYRFNVTTPGQYLYFDSIAGASTNSWILYGPGGQQLDSKDLDKDFEIALPSTGQYLLASIGRNSSATGYQFQVATSTTTPTSFTLGLPVSGTISKAGEIDNYTFNVSTAGQRVFFDGISDTANTNVRLISPGGAEIFNTQTTDNRGLLTLTETGNYRVIVDAPGTATGNYNFQFRLPSALAINSTQNVTVAANQTQLYSFSNPGNQNLYFENTVTGSPSTWTLYGPGNQIITSADSGVERELALMASGTYILALNGSASGPTTYQFRTAISSLSPTTMSLGSDVAGNINVIGKQDTYTFSTVSALQRVFFDNLTGTDVIGVRIISPSGAEIYNRRITQEQEPLTLNEVGIYRVVVDGEGKNTGNYSFRLLDIPQASNLTLNTTISGSLTRASQAQIYRFTGSSGQRLYFDLLGDWNTTNGTGWAIYSPSNQLVASNFTRLDGSSDLEVRLPGDGVYTLMIGGRPNITTAESFQFRVTTPQALTLGASVSGSISVGRQDTYTFNGTSGQRLFFDSLVGSSNVTAKLYNSSGVEIATWLTNTDGSQPLLLRDSGNYRLTITGNNNNTTGNYNFRLVDLETVPTMPLNTPVSGRLDPGAEVDFYQFNALVGQRFNFDLTAAQWTNANWVLYGPDNTAIATPANTSPDFEVTPDKAGTYVLAIRGSSSTLIDYNFRVTTSQVSVNPTPSPSTNNFVVMPHAGEKGSLDLNGTGTYRVRLDVRDGRGGKAEQDFKIRVGSEPGNNSPVIVSDPIIVAYASQIYNYDVKALDSDSDSLTYSLLDAPQGMTINASTGRISWNTPLVGQRDITVKVQDTRGGVDTQSFKLDVSNVVPATIRGRLYEDGSKTGNVTVYYNDFEDPNRSLTEWSNSQTDVTPIGNRNFLGRFAGQRYPDNLKQTKLALNNLPEHETVTISFKLFINGSWGGSVGAYAPDTWKLGVVGGPTLLYTTFGSGYFDDSGSPVPPVIPAGTESQAYPDTFVDSNPSLYLNKAGKGAAEINTLGYYLTDSWGDAVYNLSFTFNHNLGNLAFDFIGGTDEDINNESWGLDDVEVSVGGATKGLANSTVYLDSNNNNQRDSNETFTLTDSEGNYSFSVAPGSYSVAQELLTGWTQVRPTTNKHLLTVNSNQVVNNLDFANIRGASGNVAPTFITTPPLKAMVGQRYNYRAVASDLNGDALSYDLLVKPDGMVVDSKTGQVSWLPTAKLLGPQNVILRVRDGFGGIDLQSFLLDVSPFNTAPKFTNNLNDNNFEDLIASVGVPVSYRFTAIDAEGDPITYSLKQRPDKPNGVSIDPTTGVLSWTPTTEQVRLHNLFVTASDDKGNETNIPFDIRVVASLPNSSPVITSQPRRTIALGQTYFYAVKANDPNNDPLTYTIDEQSRQKGITIDNQGIVSWTPNPNQLGANSVTITVSDGRGGVTPQTFNIDVVSTTVRSNSAPSITSAPNLITNIEREYQYNLTGTDTDGDLLLWSLDNKPSGMVIDTNTGVLRWQPRKDQIGSQTVAVRLTDNYGAFVVQEFTLAVGGLNQAPQIVSTPVTRAAQNQQYTYTVVATDPENDTLTYSLGRRPTGMTIDNQGLIRWTPTNTSPQTVEVIVSDSQGATSTQTYNIEVSTTAINNAPTITSTPVYLARPGSAYQYQIVATDPDAGDSLTYQLLSSTASGMSINSTTGLLTWTNPVAGTYTIAVGAVDRGGQGAAQRFTLTARANNAPVINSNPVLNVTPGTEYIYDVKATDPDNDRLTYTLDQTSRNKGITVDEFGRVRWASPTVGTHRVVLTVTDSYSASSTPQDYNLVVAADTIAPKVSLIATFNQINLGQSVTFQAKATDNVSVAGLQLLINNQTVVLDTNGTATFTPTVAGTINARAVARDTSGNTGQATFDVFVIDPRDVTAPVVNFDFVGINSGDFVTAPTKIRATITDDTGLAYYRLLVAPVGSDDFKEVWRRNNPAAVNNAELVEKFDPSLLQNDSYVVRLEVADKGDKISYVDKTVDVAGDLKLGNFRLSFTDLAVPVTGIPITLTRTYDTLTTGDSDDFGYGWRMEFRDTDLRTSLGPNGEEEELLGRQKAFKDGTKVYITLPGGKREAFTFKPKQVEQIDGQPLGIFSKYMYTPEFVASKGVTSTLTVKQQIITRKANSNEYIGLASNAYNPADSYWGGIYVLTTKEGIVYEIDASTGDLRTVTDKNGNKLTYTDDAVTSSTGQKITFERDAQNRIRSVKDPMGELIKYDYDDNGDLRVVTDQEKFETKFIYDPNRAHYLKEIIDPLKRTAARVDYDDNGRLKGTVGSTDNAVNIEYDLNNSIQIVKDAFDKPTIYEYDTRGNVVSVTDALSNKTRMEYDDNNNLKKVTDPNNLVTKYEYYDNGDLKSRTEQYCGCAGVTPGTTYYTYNQLGQMETLTLSTGASMNMKYDSNGNMLFMKDGKGNVIQSFTYYENGLVKTETSETGTTTYEYDRFGNVKKTIDPDNSVTIMEYYNNGLLKKMTQDNGTPNNTSDDEIFTFEYDKLGRETYTNYGDGISVKYDYSGAGGDWTKLEAPTIGKIERKLTADGKLGGWITPDGGTPTFKYDKAGRLFRETDASGNDTTEYGYDAAGRLTTVKDLRTGAVSSKIYDAGGRVIEEIDPTKSFTRYKFNTRTGRLDSTERGKYLVNAAGEIVVDANNKPVVDTTVVIQTFTYEYNGLQTTVIDPLGRRTTSVTDEYYLPKETIYQLRNGQTFREKTEYLYTSNLQEAKDYPTRVVDIGGNDRVFTYESGSLKTATDLANNPYTYTYGDGGLEKITGPGPTGEKLEYRYDALGNLERVIYGNDTFKRMTYRSTDNRLETMTLPSGETLLYDYFSDGQVKSQTTKKNGVVTGTTGFTYTKEGALKTITDGTGTTTYRYDINNRLEGMDYANGSSISYTYDIIGRIKTVTEKGSATATAYTTEYKYDAFGNLNWIKDPAQGITTMKYDVVNRLKERTLPNGVKTVYDYDDLNRIQSIVHTNAQGQVLTSVSYERKGIGEPSKITREDGSYTKLEYDDALRVKKESYYNAANTLLNETTYTYDADGKRRVQSNTTNGNRTFTYTPGFQLDTVQETGETENYDYDTDGRLTLISRDGKTLDLEHDTYDRLTEVENETTGEKVKYIYDGQGNRVKAIKGSQERRFLVAPAMGGGLESTDLITDGSGNLISNYIYGGGSSPFMRLDANGNAVYYLTDAMGTVIGLANSSGQSTGKFLYDAFGNVLSQVGGANTAAGGDFRFQGQWLEQESGLYHFRARDYDPKTGLFLSRDPVDIIEMEPESFNPYQFVYNNPYVYSDPTGMFTITELNVADVIDRILRGIEQNTKYQFQQGVKEKVQEISTKVLSKFIETVTPFNFKPYINPKGDVGDVLENLLMGSVREILEDVPFLDKLYVAVGINDGGEPVYKGFNINEDIDFRAKKPLNLSYPDFIFKSGEPVDTDKNPPAYLIGDIKFDAGQIKIQSDNQSRRIFTYAKYPGVGSGSIKAVAKAGGGHAYAPFALYLSVKKVTEDEEKKYAKFALNNYGVVLSIIDFGL